VSITNTSRQFSWESVSERIVKVDSKFTRSFRHRQFTVDLRKSSVLYFRHTVYNQTLLLYQATVQKSKAYFIMNALLSTR